MGSRSARTQLTSSARFSFSAPRSLGPAGQSANVRMSIGARTHPHLGGEAAELRELGFGEMHGLPGLEEVAAVAAGLAAVAVRPAA